MLLMRDNFERSMAIVLSLSKTLSVLNMCLNDCVYCFLANTVMLGWFVLLANIRKAIYAKAQAGGFIKGKNS